MKKIFLLLTLIAVTVSAMAQNRIPHTNLVFGFPDGGWKYLQTYDVDANTSVYLYSFCGETVIDKMGDTILPNMRIYVRKNFTKSVYDLVFQRYDQNPYQSLEEYTDGLPSEGIGYKGYYINVQDAQKPYMFDMIYFKDGTTAFEIRIETTADTYERFQARFKNILGTVKLDN